MANKVGSQELESKPNEQAKITDSYKLTSFKAIDLPTEFKNLIMAPFLNSLKSGNDMFKLIDRDCYYKAYSKYIEHLLQRPGVAIKLAILDDGTVLGWCMSEGSVLHYVWVKKEVRRNGIGKALVPKDFDTITHITNVGMNIWVNKYPEVRLNPFE